MAVDSRYLLGLFSDGGESETEDLSGKCLKVLELGGGRRSYSGSALANSWVIPPTETSRPGIDIYDLYSLLTLGSSGFVGILVKLNAYSEGKPNGIPG
jgi:hypothetical protein